MQEWGASGSGGGDRVEGSSKRQSQHIYIYDPKKNFATCPLDRMVLDLQATTRPEEAAFGQHILDKSQLGARCVTGSLGLALQLHSQNTADPSPARIWLRHVCY